MDCRSNTINLNTSFVGPGNCGPWELMGIFYNLLFTYIKKKKSSPGPEISNNTSIISGGSAATLKSSVIATSNVKCLAFRHCSDNEHHITYNKSLKTLHTLTTLCFFIMCCAHACLCTDLVLLLCRAGWGRGREGLLMFSSSLLVSVTLSTAFFLAGRGALRQATLVCFSLWH